MNYLQKKTINSLSLLLALFAGMNFLQAQDGLGAFIPSTGMWLLDYDADGRIDKKVSYGAKGYSDELPLVGDFNGDGVAELGRFRPSQSTIFIDLNGDRSSDLILKNIGKPGDQVAVVNFDKSSIKNSYKDEITIHRPSTGVWGFDYDLDGRFDDSRNYGTRTSPDETALAGDFNGDGKTDLCRYRSSTGQWFFDYDGDNKSDHFVSNFGGRGIQGAVGDFNGDGKTDIAKVTQGNAGWAIDFNLDGIADQTVYGIGGSQTIPIAIPKSLEKKFGRDNTQTVSSTTSASSSTAQAITVSMVNHSDWTVRFKFVYKDGTQSGWTTINAHSSKSGKSIAKEVEGVKIKWLDVTTWKNIGGMATWSQNGTSWSYTVSGKVFPHKPISIK
ncbi:MAG: VCBS repeat-containing protein [Bacteroidia bacterium]